MSLTDAFVGLVKTVATRGRMERLLHQLGWSIDRRKGDTLALNFKCPVIGTRQVFINRGDEPFVLFVTYSDVVFDSREVPDTAMGFALVQNDKSPMGKWEMSISNGELLFRQSYTALGEGLTAAAVKLICESMAKAASEFDARMRQEGYR